MSHLEPEPLRYCAFEGTKIIINPDGTVTSMEIVRNTGREHLLMTHTTDQTETVEIAHTPISPYSPEGELPPFRVVYST